MARAPIGPPTRRELFEFTEVPGEAVRRDVLDMMWMRYAFAVSHVAGKDVLEVGCGSAVGLGLLARTARRVVAGDRAFPIARRAAQHYDGRAQLLCLDAIALPFRDACFDVVLCYEALYLFPDADAFCAEAARILRPGGKLLVAQVNPRWHGFIPLEISTRYHSGQELATLLARHGLRPEVYVAFPDRDVSAAHRAVRLLRRVAAALGIAPRTVRAKRLLRRLFYARLIQLPAELVGDVPPAPLLRPLQEDNGEFVYLYAVAERALAPQSFSRRFS